MGRTGSLWGMQAQVTEQASYPGQSIGLPESGRGSLASWRARIAAIVIDWAASMLVAYLLFGMGALRGNDWRQFTIMGVFVVESTILTALAGGSFGHLLARIGVARLDGEKVTWWQGLLRAVMKCLIIPMIVVGAERRALDDLALGTAMVNRR